MNAGFPHPCVIIGLDDSLTGLAALRAAVAESLRRGVPLCAVRAGAGSWSKPDPAMTAAVVRQALGAVPPGLAIHQWTPMVPILQALRDAATDPRDLIVVGTSGRGLWHAFWSGSVARALLRHARCPVLAVPAPEMAEATRRIRRRPRWFHRDLWDQIEREVPELRGVRHPGR